MNSRCLPAPLQTLSRLFHLIHFVKCWQFFLEFLGLNSKRLYQSSGKEKESRCLVFTFSTKREIRHFHVVVVQWGQRNGQKRVMHEQSCCFANLNVLFFCRSRWRRRRRCLSSLFAQCRVNVTLFYRFVKRETSKTTQVETWIIEHISLHELWQPKARFVYTWVSLLFFTNDYRRYWDGRSLSSEWRTVDNEETEDGFWSR